MIPVVVKFFFPECSFVFVNEFGDVVIQGFDLRVFRIGLSEFVAFVNKVTYVFRK